MNSHPDPAREFRRLSSRLLIDGRGIILFNIWSILKGILYLAYDKNGLPAIAAEKNFGRAEWFIAFLTVFIILFSEFLVRFFVGRSAIREGKSQYTGKRIHSFYLIPAFLLLFLDIFFMAVNTGLVVNSAEDDFLNTAASMIVDFSSSLIVLDLIITALRLRSLRHKHERGDI